MGSMEEFKAGGRTLPFISKGCKKNRYTEIEIYDFVFIKGLAVT